jgi:hypothetical protein
MRSRPARVTRSGKSKSAFSRNVTPAVDTEDMFKTTHDAANREAMRAVLGAELNLVGLTMRAERKLIDGLKFHRQAVDSETEIVERSLIHVRFTAGRNS